MDEAHDSGELDVERYADLDYSRDYKADDSLTQGIKGLRSRSGRA